MLTFPQIVRKTPKLRKENSLFVRLSTPKFGYTKKGTAFAAVKSYSTHIKLKDGSVVKHVSPEKYVTVVEFLDNRLHVNLSCSCPDFLYRFEVALNKKGAAQIEYSNGELPTVTNPTMIAACCKHCIALYNSLKGVMTTEMMKPIEPVVERKKPVIKKIHYTGDKAKPGIKKYDIDYLKKRYGDRDLSIKPADRLKFPGVKKVGDDLKNNYSDILKDMTTKQPTKQVKFPGVKKLGDELKKNFSDFKKDMKK